MSSAGPKAITTSKRRGVDNTRTDVATGAGLFEASSTPQEDDSASEDGRKGKKGTTGASHQGKDDAAGKRRAGASRQGNDDAAGKRRAVVLRPNNRARAADATEINTEDDKVMEIMRLIRNNQNVEVSTIRDILKGNSPKKTSVPAVLADQGKRVDEDEHESSAMKNDPVGKYLVETYRQAQIMEKKPLELIHFKEIPKDGVQVQHVASLLGPELASRQTAIQERSEKIKQMKFTLHGWALGIVNIEQYIQMHYNDTLTPITRCFFVIP